MSVLQLDLSRQKLYMSPDDPLPQFHPTPRAILVTPIYDTPFPWNGPSFLSENPELNQPSWNGQPSPWLIDRSSDPMNSNAERYQASSSRRQDYRPYTYSPARDQRYDPDLPYYPDRYSRSYPQDRSGRRRPSDYYDDSFDNDRPRDDDYSSDNDNHDYPPKEDRSSNHDRFPSDHDRPPLGHDDRSSLDYDRPSQQHNRRSSLEYDRPPQQPNRRSSLDNDRPSQQPNRRSSLDYDRPSQQNNRRSSQPQRSTYHEPERPTHTTKTIPRLQRYLEKNRQAANIDPFRHLKTVSEDVQRVFKVLPPSPHFCWSQCTGRRKAVCIGINYVGQKDQLKGCSNDARHMRSFIMKYHQFQSQDVLLLTDDGQPASMEPTRKNMINAMSWLVKDAKMHDSLFFHYSGHGGQVKNETGTESDGMDEVIFPADFNSTSHIVDDDLFKALVAPLPTGCRLTAVFDSCHSGTILDLPYLHSAHGRLRSLAHITQRAQQRTVAPTADVICFAGCKDDETSADTFEGGVAVGAMSYALLKVLKENEENKITYSQILQQVRAVLLPNYSQKPQISGTHPVDLDRDFTL